MERTFRKVHLLQHTTAAPTIAEATITPWEGDTNKSMIVTSDWSNLHNSKIGYYMNQHLMYSSLPMCIHEFRVKSVEIHVHNAQLLVKTPLSATETTTITHPYYEVAIDNQGLYQQEGFDDTGIYFSPNTHNEIMHGTLATYTPGYDHVTLHKVKEFIPGDAYALDGDKTETYTVNNCYRNVAAICGSTFKYPPDPWSWKHTVDGPWITANHDINRKHGSTPINEGMCLAKTALGRWFTAFGVDLAENTEADQSHRNSKRVPMILVRSQRQVIGATAIETTLNLVCEYVIHMEFRGYPWKMDQNIDGILDVRRENDGKTRLAWPHGYHLFGYNKDAVHAFHANID